MIRVAFVLNSGGTHWMGGVNYMTNLLRAIATRPGLRPVIFSAGAEIPKEFSEFRGLEYVQTRYVDPKSRTYLVRKSLARVLSRDIIFEQFLRRHRIDVLSHYGHLGPRAKLPTIAWIPDFQHVHLAAFFSAAEVLSRSAMYLRLARAASIIVLSSENAQNDLNRLHPFAAPRTRVLRFVCDVANTLSDVAPRAALEAEYGLTGPYFHLPNQFWMHKNHAVVIEALAIARKAGRPLLVVATGHTRDARHPDHFQTLMSRVAELGCADDFRVLGLVPHAMLTALMVHSCAIVNPSRFEGWSTTVEEGKSIGKRVILSDIQVHQEQRPEHGTYFALDDAPALAKAMLEHVDSFTTESEELRQTAARGLLAQRFGDFGGAYEAIARDAASAALPS